MINYKLLGCYKIIKNSTFKQYINNVGLYLGAIIILYNIVTIFIFFGFFLNKIRTEAFRQIPTLFKLKKMANKIKRKDKKKEENIPNSSKQRNIPSNPKIKKILRNSKKHFADKSQKKNKIITETNSFNNRNSYILINNSNKLINFISPFHQKSENKKNDEIDFKKLYLKKIRLNDEDVDINDYNTLPYTQALRIDKRNIFLIFMNLIKMKIDIISIIFYPEEYTNRTLLISTYLLDFLFNYFMNALLYSDDVVSQKYHNNGSLNFVTSLSLSLASNIISSIAIWIVKKLTNYHELMEYLVKNIYNEKDFIYFFYKIHRFLKIKISIYFILNFIVVVAITYYVFIFCIIYKKSQISLLSNYFLGIAESMLKTLVITFVVCILRFVALKIKSKRIYRTSVYLNDLF